MSGKRCKAVLWGGIPLAALAVLVLVQACSKNERTFRFRLSFAVNVDGEVKSASSVIQASYERFGSQNAAGASGTAWHRGVAPIIDLGKHGYLIASMSASCIYPNAKGVEKGLFPLAMPNQTGPVLIPDTTLACYPVPAWGSSGAACLAAATVCRIASPDEDV